MRRFDNLADWLAWQETLHPRAIDLGLDRVRRVARTLGVDRLDVPVFTVGGTNGKGSAVALLDSILSASGQRVATFTSPHLVRYHERIRIDGRPVSDESLVDAFTRIDAARRDTSLTFFEFNTLAALLAFRDAPIDVAVLEVGLGGRLDAVNLVDAHVALLMSVDLDHMDWLGDSLEDIGREKAGIFRAGRPAVLGTATMPASVFEAARQLGADLRLPPRDFSYTTTGQGWNWRGRNLALDNLPRPALDGEHQLGNAAAVLAALEAFGSITVTHDGVSRGLQQVTLSGRFQVVPGDVEWIFDVAHNPAAAATLAASLGERRHRGHRGGRTFAVVGILSDKDVVGVVSALDPHINHWIAAGLSGPRGLTGQQLAQLCSPHTRATWETAEDVAQACELARKQASAGDRVVVFGSFHTVGPALEWQARQ
jgi:dihydrofolate synthase/folylpolyglutamate synthase